MEENKPKRFFGYTVMQLCCCLIGCYAYLAYGCIDSSKSVYFPLIQEYYHLEYNYQGLLVGISSIGYLAFSLFVGYLSIRVGIKWTLSLGFFILTIAFLAGYSIVHIGLVVACLIIVGIGIVFLDVSINTWSTVLFTSHKAVMMNILHCFYGFGASIGPIISSVITVQMNQSYRGVFAACILYGFSALLIALLIPKSESKPQKSEDESSDFTIRSALKHPVTWLFGIAQGCAIGAEVINTTWAPIYLRDVYGWDPKTRGARFVSTFYMLYTISRLLSGFFIDYFGGLKSLVLYKSILILLSVLAFLLGEKGVICLVLMGLFYAPFFPTIFTVAMTYFGRNVDRCTCVILFMYMIVNPVIQYIVGVLMKHIGVEWGYRFSVVVLLVLLVDLLLIGWFLKKKENDEKEALLHPSQVLSVCLELFREYHVLCVPPFHTR